MYVFGLPFPNGDLVCKGLNGSGARGINNDMGQSCVRLYALWRDVSAMPHVYCSSCLSVDTAWESLSKQLVRIALSGVSPECLVHRSDSEGLPQGAAVTCESRYGL
jgi:hypothetical protein